MHVPVHFSGSRLRALRVARGVSLESVAVSTGKSFHTVIAYERGRVVPPADVLGDLAAAIDCAPGDFFEPIEKVA